MISTNYIKKSRLSLVGLIIFSTIFDMGGGFGIKYFSYGISLVYLIFNPQVYRSMSRGGFYLFAVFFVLPLLSLFIGAFRGGDLALGISQITPFIPCLITWLLIKDNTDASSKCLLWFFNGLLYLSYLIILLFIVGEIFRGTSFISNIYSLLNESSQGFFGLKQVGGFQYPGVYFKATLYIVGAFTFFLFKREFSKVLVCITAIVFSFSKSAMVVSLLVMLLYFLSSIKINKGRVFISLHTFIVSLFIISLGFLVYFKYDIFFDNFFDTINAALTGNAGTSLVRIGHFKSIVNLFKENPSFFFFGQGLGTGFYSLGEQAIVSNIELDHLESIRKYGAIWFVILVVTILYLIDRLIKDNSRVLALILTVYFIVLGTNPLLINPLFFIFLILIYQKCIK